MLIEIEYSSQYHVYAVQISNQKSRKYFSLKLTLYFMMSFLPILLQPWFTNVVFQDAQLDLPKLNEGKSLHA